MKRDRLIVFVLVGVMLFSAVATGLLFLAQGDETSTADNATSESEKASNEQVCTASEEVVNQAGNPVGEWPVEVESATELQTIDLREGLGDAAVVGNCITVHYRLALADGTTIEGNDTFMEGQPIAFELIPGRLIEGWTQGIPGLKEGGLRRLIVPPTLGYGSEEQPGIPADSTLVFDVELVKIEY